MNMYLIEYINWKDKVDYFYIVADSIAEATRTAVNMQGVEEVKKVSEVKDG